MSGRAEMITEVPIDDPTSEALFLRDRAAVKNHLV